MITTLLGLYTNLVIAGENPMNTSSANLVHTMPWSDNRLLDPQKIPSKNNVSIAPVIKAKAALAIDLESGVVLYEKNIHEPLAIASLTKLLTGIIIIENHKLDEVVTISRKASATDGSKAWLAAGEKITIENLLYSIFIHSANDAAVALAEYDSGDVASFVEKMNEKSRTIGMLNSHFINPIGLDEDENYTEETENSNEQPLTAEQELANKTNVATAYDLGVLAKYAYGKNFIKQAASTKELEVSSTDGALVHKLKNTNELLGSYLHVIGLKTGTTDLAGQCLITIIEQPNGEKILTIMLNSPDRFTETKILADWVTRNYNWPGDKSELESNISTQETLENETPSPITEQEATPH